MTSGICLQKPEALTFNYYPGCKLYIVNPGFDSEEHYSPDAFYEKFDIIDTGGEQYNDDFSSRNPPKSI